MTIDAVSGLVSSPEARTGSRRMASGGSGATWTQCPGAGSSASTQVDDPVWGPAAPRPSQDPAPAGSADLRRQPTAHGGFRRPGTLTPSQQRGPSTDQPGTTRAKSDCRSPCPPSRNRAPPRPPPGPGSREASRAPPINGRRSNSRPGAANRGRPEPASGAWPWAEPCSPAARAPPDGPMEALGAFEN